MRSISTRGFVIVRHDAVARFEELLLARERAMDAAVVAAAAVERHTHVLGLQYITARTNWTIDNATIRMRQARLLRENADDVHTQILQLKNSITEVEESHSRKLLYEQIRSVVSAHM